MYTIFPPPHVLLLAKKRKEASTDTLISPAGCKKPLKSPSTSSLLKYRVLSHIPHATSVPHPNRPRNEIITEKIPSQPPRASLRESTSTSSFLSHASCAATSLHRLPAAALLLLLLLRVVLQHRHAVPRALDAVLQLELPPQHGAHVVRRRDVAAQVACEGAKFVTGFSQWVKGQAQGSEPGAFQLRAAVGQGESTRAGAPTASRARKGMSLSSCWSLVSSNHDSIGMPLFTWKPNARGEGPADYAHRISFILVTLAVFWVLSPASDHVSLGTFGCILDTFASRIGACNFGPGSRAA
jgi:hypothetical protein